jgi:hypothetical protein
MKHRRATLLMLLALLLPVPSGAGAYDDMFGLMFRMMLTAMNVMADMAGNNNDWGWGGGWPASGWTNPWGSPLLGSAMLWPGMGSGGWPGSPGMSPLGMTPWGGGLPWSAGQLPWSAGQLPWSTGGPAGIPFAAPGGVSAPVAPVAPSPVRAAPLSSALLDGKWYGDTGEILEIRGNRFRLRNAQLTIKGVANIEHNLLKLFTPQTNALTVYSFVRNQTELILQDPSGNVLVFRHHPYPGPGYPVRF